MHVGGRPRMRRRLAASAVPSLAAGLVLLAGGAAAAQPPGSGEAGTGVTTEGLRPTWTEFFQQSDPSGLGGLQSTAGLPSVLSPSWLDSLRPRSASSTTPLLSPSWLDGLLAGLHQKPI